MQRTMFPRDGAQRGILLGFSPRRLCCLVCIRLTEPRLLGPPRAVRLDKNNCKEGREEGQSEAVRPFKVTQWVEGLRSCSPGIPRSWLCSKAIHYPAPAQATFPLMEGTMAQRPFPVEQQSPDKTGRPGLTYNWPSVAG